ncbi:hypothetical protein [Paucibacter sp. XJ19-41]|uniref:hypothetical protein n=1 Tax=Paucibacter sp. XJ19-41 TaxID=2927824 RepID=UPI00234A711E|nr:hypothetical protein [Paucibacter sp. XJ19-41]MDC6166412.1 hypothetical protein [Paucibacter sp. XJ19-41]
MNAQALITIHDVQASIRWSQATLGATALEPVNPYAGHREVWLRDPDGSTVVIAGRYGDLGPGAGP